MFRTTNCSSSGRLHKQLYTVFLCIYKSSPATVRMCLIVSYCIIPLLQFQYMHLYASGELLNGSHRHSHTDEGVSIQHESWLPQEVLRYLPHCLHSSVPQPESSIMYGMNQTFPNQLIIRKLFASCVSYYHVHSSVTTRTGDVVKNLKPINLSRTKYRLCYA